MELAHERENGAVYAVRIALSAHSRNQFEQRTKQPKAIPQLMSSKTNHFPVPGQFVERPWWQSDGIDDGNICLGPAIELGRLAFDEYAEIRSSSVRKQC